MFKVFNRFGQLVFYSNNINDKWDGTLKGLPQPAGAYVWMLEYNDEAGKKTVAKGTTILIR